MKEVKLLIISHQRSNGKGERKVKSKASMVALVAWPEGKLNLSTILTVATLTRGEMLSWKYLVSKHVRHIGDPDC